MSELAAHILRNQLSTTPAVAAAKLGARDFSPDSVIFTPDDSNRANVVDDSENQLLDSARSSLSRCQSFLFVLRAIAFVLLLLLLASPLIVAVRAHKMDSVEDQISRLLPMQEDENTQTNQNQNTCLLELNILQARMLTENGRSDDGEMKSAAAVIAEENEEQGRGQLDFANGVVESLKEESNTQRFI